MTLTNGSPTLSNPIYIPDSSDLYIRTNAVLSGDTTTGVDNVTLSQLSYYRPGSKFYGSVLTKNPNRGYLIYETVAERPLKSTYTGDTSCIQEDYRNIMLKKFGLWFNAAYIGYDQLGNKMGMFALENFRINSDYLSFNLLFRPEEYSYVPWDDSGELSGFPVVSFTPYDENWSYNDLGEYDLWSNRWTIYLARIKYSGYYEYRLISYSNGEVYVLCKWYAYNTYGRNKQVFGEFLGRWIGLAFAIDLSTFDMDVVVNYTDNILFIDNATDPNNISNTRNSYSIFFDKFSKAPLYVTDESETTLLSDLYPIVIRYKGNPGYQTLPLQKYTNYIFSVGDVYYPDGSRYTNNVISDNKSNPCYFSGVIGRVRVLDGLKMIPGYMYNLMENSSINDDVNVKKIEVDQSGENPVYTELPKEELFSYDNRKIIESVYNPIPLSDYNDTTEESSGFA